MFYINVERIGDKIYERYIEEGVEKERWVDYSPCLFSSSSNPSKYKDIYGGYCEKRQFDKMSEANNWRKHMKDIGLSPMGQEDFRIAYISDNYPNTIAYDAKTVRVCNFDIEVTGRNFPFPSEVRYEIDAITHYDSIEDKFYVFDLLKSDYGTVKAWDKKIASLSGSEGGDEVSDAILSRVEYMAFQSERELLLQYISLWEEQRPAVITGWNIDGFDIPYLINRIKKVLGDRHTKRLSPVGKINSKILTDKYGKDNEVFTITGVAVLDYILLYKKFSFTNQPSYALGYVAQYETKKSKLEYDGPINKLRETNHQRYISYNIIDVESVLGIDRKRGFINLSVALAYYAKVSIGDVLSPVKMWDSIIFNNLKVDNKVIPENKMAPRSEFGGAFVKEPIPGAYNFVVSFDATSLNVIWGFM